jgi:hypothetical protein
MVDIGGGLGRVYMYNMCFDKTLWMAAARRNGGGVCLLYRGITPLRQKHRKSQAAELSGHVKPIRHHLIPLK